MAIGFCRKSAAPFYGGACQVGIFQHSGKAVIASGNKLRPVIKGSPADSSGGHAASHAPAFLDDQGLASAVLQRGSGGQAGHASPNYQHIERSADGAIHSGFA
jgi:hypothetical protein